MYMHLVMMLTTHIAVMVVPWVMLLAHAAAWHSKMESNSFARRAVARSLFSAN
jgi:hypothetical protein